MKWEYKVRQFAVRGCFGRKVDTEEMETELNQHGAEGWELIKISDILKDFGATTLLVATLRRPMP